MRIVRPHTSVDRAGITGVVTRYVRGLRTGEVRDLGLLVVLLAAVPGIVFAIDPRLDLRLPSLFFGDTTRAFLAAPDPGAVALPRQSIWIFTSFADIIVAMAMARPEMPWPSRSE